jgi:hypothetical protein
MIRNRRDVLRGLSAMAGVNLLCPRTLFAEPAARTAPITMVNGAAAAGLDFVLRNGAAGRLFQVETMPGGLGVIDFDGDGWPDIFCTNGAELPALAKSGPQYWNRLYKNNRDGSFTDVTAKAGLAGEGFSIGVAVGDYDNDGHEDLFVVGVHRNYLYHNNGDGSFTDVTAKAGLVPSQLRKPPLWAVSACWIDYDNDGRLDLFVSNYCDWEAGSDPVCGGMADGARSYCHPNLYRAEPMQLFHNNGDGTFTEVPLKEGKDALLGKGMGIAVADYAGDGRAALFVANDNARNLLLRNHGKGLEEVGIDAGVAYNGDGRNISGMGADFGDLRGKGLFDLVMTGLKNDTYEIFYNNGDGTFDDGGKATGLLNLSRKWNGWGCGLVDLDNDGWIDFFVACGGLMPTEPQANRVFWNEGGKFSDRSAEAGLEAGAKDGRAQHRCVAFADFDRDGRVDAVVTAINAPIELWWNRSDRESRARHWLQLKLAGVNSNRSAIGAEVRVTAGGRRQVRTVTNSVGYASSSDLVVHIGLGEATEASVEIRWPAGGIQKLDKVAADQRLTIQEKG